MLVIAAGKEVFKIKLVRCTLYETLQLLLGDSFRLSVFGIDLVIKENLSS